MARGKSFSAVRRFSKIDNSFDYYLFAQQWPGSYCDTKKGCCFPMTGEPGPVFGIHGLWPNRNDGTYSKKCGSTASNPNEFWSIKMADPATDRSFSKFPVDFPLVKTAITSLQLVGDLIMPRDVVCTSGMDMMDWLGSFFGFQAENARNQREHLVMLLAIGMM